MGCDIHFRVEGQQLKNGTWERVKQLIAPCRFCGGTKKDKRKVICESCKRDPQDHEALTRRCLFGPGSFEPVPAPCFWPECNAEGKELRDYYEGRDYELFGVLSGVRAKPDPDFTHEDRGLPDDVSDEIALESNSIDYHSHGYYYLDELKRYPWIEKDFSSFWRTVENMQKLLSHYNDVRAVFWYDN